MQDTQHISEDYQRTEDGMFIATCSCGWKSEPMPTDDEAENAHSEHMNEMMKEKS